MPTPSVIPPPPGRLRPVVSRPEPAVPTPVGPGLRIVPWVDPVADPHGMHPCSRYVELYWLGIIGPSTTWLLRRLNYGLEVHSGGFDLNLPETARALGLGDKMGKNSPFRRALARLITFELARSHGPGELAVRSRIPPLPLRHVSRLPDSLQRSHRRWMAEQQLPEPEQMRRRAVRLAVGLAAAGHDRTAIERRLAQWQFHPAIAFHAAGVASGDGSGGTADVAPGGRHRSRGDAGNGASGEVSRSGVRTIPVTIPTTTPATTVGTARGRPVRPVHPLLADHPVQSCAPDAPDRDA